MRQEEDIKTTLDYGGRRLRRWFLCNSARLAFRALQAVVRPSPEKLKMKGFSARGECHLQPLASKPILCIDDYRATSSLTPRRAICDAVLYGLIFPGAVFS